MKRGYRYWQRKSFLSSLFLSGILCSLAGAETAGVAVLIEDRTPWLPIVASVVGVLVTVAITAYATWREVGRLFDSIKGE